MPGKSKLRVLALDTSTSRGSVGLLCGRELRAELRMTTPETHSARLLRSIDFLLDSLGWTLGDLDLIAAGIGPGSFTGIRIGIATAMGLAQSLKLPYAGVSGMDALAESVRVREAYVGVVLDAQRSQIYYAEYKADRRGLRRLRGPELLDPVSLRGDLARRSMVLVGDGARRYADELGAARGSGPRLVEMDLFLAAAVGRCALSRPAAWCKGDFLRSKTLYIRPPDALAGRGGKSSQ